jgi:hypothetical protein
MRIAAALTLAIACCAVIAIGCARDRDAGVKARAAAPSPLTREEMAQLLDAIGRAMTGKSMRVQQGAVARPLAEKERAQIFDVLSDARGLEDAGLQTIGNVRVRGLRIPQTSPQSEIEATGTVWIDVARLLPRRYDFVYAMPGFGDITLDLTYETTP